MLLQLLKENAVKVLINTKVTQVDFSTVTVDSPEGEKTFEMDLIILAAGRKPVNHLVKVAKEWVDEVWVIGDCIAPRKIKDAVWEAYGKARLI